ncbi:MAG: hypothetical protein ACRCT8_07345 [Lacipirellulaceae bacterium]
MDSQRLSPKGANSMWCRHCQQEVPSIGPTTPHGGRCARCQKTAAAPAKVPAVALGAASGAAIPAGDVSWRAIDSALRSARATVSAGEAARTLRFDLAESGLVPRAGSLNPQPARREVVRRPPPRRVARTGQRLAWFVAALGVAMLGLGIGMMATSAFGDRPDLWNPAVGATLAGQGLVIVGLVQLLGHVWTACRQAIVKLSQVHDELRSLRRVADEQAGRHAATAGQFYAELARGAGNEVLLGNLRGQVERLATRLRAE